MAGGTQPALLIFQPLHPNAAPFTDLVSTPPLNSVRDIKLVQAKKKAYLRLAMCESA